MTTNKKPEAKTIALSFSKRYDDQELLEWVESQRDYAGISNYIKALIRKDYEEKNSLK